MKNSISIKNVGKSYKIYPSRMARLREWLNPFSSSMHEDKWVLKDINLEVSAGEAVGVIGMNGAGKSTLLKIITGTTVPTTGTVSFDGTVSALLELGLGFHPDFTGRQNAYMSGQLLGYTIEEIDTCMQQIEEFAEIGEAIDAPVRTYSSGMQVRLAFSVATMKRPDILIVDEALSVGDVYFQHKSFNRIKQFREKGTTLLLVSHDKAAIQAVCDRAILLDHGSVLKTGSPEEIMDYYNAMIGGNEGKPIEQKRLNGGRVQTISGNGQVRIQTVEILNAKGEVAEVFDVGEHVCMRIYAEVCDEIDDLTCGVSIRNRLGESVFGINTKSFDSCFEKLHNGNKVKFEFRLPLNLGQGTYSVTVALHSGRSHVGVNYEWRDLAVVFEIINQTKREFDGIAYIDAEVDSVLLL
ncbi:MAG: ABC transporter ATP-binding protein [Selenomonas sp.]|nr:ABC transporter ATP-binding protein [Selenomonas sp.]